jgi:hypothetical protein
MPATRLQRIFLLSGILSLAIAYVGLWLRFINDPVERTGSDFIAFYSAGRVAQEYGFSRVFEPDLQQAVQAETVGFPLVKGQVLLHNHPPLLPPILRLLVTHNYVESFYRWIALLITIFIASLFILRKALDLSGIDPQTNLLLAISAFLFMPFFFSLMNGQDTVIVFLGMALWFYGLISGKDWLAGFGLSLTVLRPQFSIALAIPMLFGHRKAFWGYFLGSSFLVLLAFLINGLDGMQQYLNILLISVGGEWHGMKEEAMLNLLGMMMRIFGAPAADTIRVIGWVVYAISILLLTYLWAKQKTSRENLIGLTVVIALFASPHLHFHDLTLLLIPIYALVISGRLKKFAATAFPIAASLLLLVSNISPILQYTTPYLLMGVLAYYPFYAKANPSLTSPRRS